MQDLAGAPLTTGTALALPVSCFMLQARALDLAAVTLANAIEHLWDIFKCANYLELTASGAPPIFIQ
jgi:hypothetical protein